ncbi:MULTISPECIES: TerC family protein [Bacillus]|uniref:TerC family protein n=1 Tax=Bacillus TaxID=1386 RepID=UPI0015834B89|nr:TerC family protein [Bacillus glycinifermentans]MBU8785938.1 TerC family protein [Bacillus glycinifermentans]NUJ15526.1 TerC family protein [Bacillus glycinifermentans]
MDLFNHIISIYASFFDWKMWVEVLSDPVSWGLIGSLVVLEGLLSADNALVLAVMVKHLPEKQRKKALTYGLVGAYFFRFLFIGLGMILIKFWWIKLLGAAYLAWLVIKHFFIGEGDDDANTVKKDGWMVRVFGMFWATVITVELMDLAFSVDSILAAFAISEKVWVLLIGGMLGILMMRTVAKFFLTLIDKVPELETTAFILIGIIALKMAASVWHIEMPHSVFFIILVIAFAATFIIHYMNKQKAVKEQTAASKEE